MTNKKPKAFLIFKLVGFLFIIASVLLIVFSFIVESEWKGHAPHPALMIPGALLIIPAISLIVYGFSPEISKFALNNARYIQQETKDTQKDIIDTTEEIAHDAIKNTAKAIKEGLNDDVKYCEDCGEKIDDDSTFCNHCGKEQ